MRDSFQVTFRNMSAHPALSEAVRARAEWLGSFHPDVAGCRVALAFPHRHNKHGRPFSVHIQLSIPGEDVTVSHEALLHRSPEPLEADAAGDDHRDAVAAINDAFDVARRRLEDAARKRRGD